MSFGKSRFITFDDIKDGERIAIYGAGGNGLAVLNEILQHRDVLFQFFLDSFRDGSFEGFEIVQFPRSAKNFEKNDIHIIIASHFWQEIVKNLEDNDIYNFSIYDPNIVQGKAIDHFYTTIERSFNLLSGFGEVYEKLSEVQKNSSVLVLHENNKFSPLQVHGKCWEGNLNYEDPDIFHEEYEKLPVHQTVSLVPAGTSRHNFFLKLLSILPKKVNIYFCPGPSRKLKAFVCEHEKVIFFPIPKCASSSILSLLQTNIDNSSVIHGFSSPNGSYQYIDLDTFPLDDYFKFSFCRDPFSRLLSLFKDKVGQGKWLDATAKSLRISRFHDFVNFVTCCPDAIADAHFESQHRFITDSKGRVVVDFLGNLETFSEDWNKLKEIGPIFANAYHLNKSKSSQDKLQMYKKLLPAVQKRYQYDYAMRGESGLPGSPLTSGWARGHNGILKTQP